MKYGKAIVSEIEGYLRDGMTQEDSATLAGISVDTFYDWKKKKPEFSEAIKRAQLHCKQRNVGIIQRAALTTWQAAAWWLERTTPDQFALKQRIEHSGTLTLEDLIVRANEADTRGADTRDK